MKSVIGTMIVLAIILLVACSGTRKPEKRKIIEPVNSNQQLLQRNGDYLVFNVNGGSASLAPVLPLYT